jgi:hypothetical protein
MKSFIKTALVAAVGAAVITASPAFAARAKQTDRAQSYSGAVLAAAPGYGVRSPAPFWTDPGQTQITLEYLKDAPIHNGNAY